MWCMQKPFATAMSSVPGACSQRGLEPSEVHTRHADAEIEQRPGRHALLPCEDPSRRLGDGRVVADRRDSLEVCHGAESDSWPGGALEATLGHLEEQRQPAASEVAEDEMPAGHGHQLEQQRVRNARRTRRPTEHIVVAVKGLLHLDAELSVESERYHLVDESIAHQRHNRATIAIAWVSVCDSDTVLRVNPALATASATTPPKARLGAPAGSRVTSTSRQRITSAQPVPSALSVASLAANRAARCTHGRCWLRQYASSASLNVSARRSSRPSNRVRKAATSTRSTPTRTEAR